MNEKLEKFLKKDNKEIAKEIKEIIVMPEWFSFTLLSPDNIPRWFWIKHGVIDSKNEYSSSIVLSSNKILWDKWLNIIEELTSLQLEDDNIEKRDILLSFIKLVNSENIEEIIHEICQKIDYDYKLKNVDNMISEIMSLKLGIKIPIRTFENSWGSEVCSNSAFIDIWYKVNKAYEKFRILLEKEREKLERIEMEKYKEDISSVGDKIFEMAKKDGLSSVSTSHIKLYALLQKIDVSGQTGLLALYVNRKLGQKLDEPKRAPVSKALKLEILRDYDNKCFICKKNSKDVLMHIHHKDGNPKNNSLDNLIPLCAKCHAESKNVI